MEEIYYKLYKTANGIIVSCLQLFDEIHYNQELFLKDAEGKQLEFRDENVGSLDYVDGRTLALKWLSENVEERLIHPQDLAEIKKLFGTGKRLSALNLTRSDIEKLRYVLTGDENDTCRDKEIMSYNADEAFEMLLRYEGLHNMSDKIKAIYERCYNKGGN